MNKYLLLLGQVVGIIIVMTVALVRLPTWIYGTVTSGESIKGECMWVLCKDGGLYNLNLYKCIYIRGINSSKATDCPRAELMAYDDNNNYINISGETHRAALEHLKFSIANSIRDNIRLFDVAESIKSIIKGNTINDSQL